MEFEDGLKEEEEKERKVDEITLGVLKHGSVAGGENVEGDGRTDLSWSS